MLEEMWKHEWLVFLDVIYRAIVLCFILVIALARSIYQTKLLHLILEHNQNESISFGVILLFFVCAKAVAL